MTVVPLSKARDLLVDFLLQVRFDTTYAASRNKKVWRNDRLSMVFAGKIRVMEQMACNNWSTKS